MTQRKRKIGVVTSGSLLEGLTARIESDGSVEDLRVGQFVVVQGEKNQFFSMVTDVRLEATSQRILADPPGDEDFVAEVLSGTSTYATVTLSPMLMLPEDVSQGLRPVKTIPRHFSPIFDAAEEDFARVFGAEGGQKFQMGMPLDMDIPVCLDLGRFVERSNGVFGKSGTGKSFLTRLLLCGAIKAGAASNLIFDMHSEYGWDSRSEEGHFVKGLRQLFGAEVLIFSLDPHSSKQRGVRVDAEVVIGLDHIEVEDIILLQDELNLTSTAAESSYLLVDHFKERWLKTLLDMDSEQLEEFASRSGAHSGALSALKRKLGQLPRRGYIGEQVPGSAIDSIIEALSAGKHVVLEFGHYHRALDYMLVANIITRRIHQRWVQQTERYMMSKNEADRPRQLMITIEEAHKFLSSAGAKQTIFGTIAREMRKYAVTLLVVDQRPSSIDSEVLSQLGTRITALLNDDRDIEAVFTGVSGSQKLKAVLASLDSRQQSMILGHAVPMPVVIRTRPYDEDFYRALGHQERSPTSRRLAQAEVDDLFS